MKCFLKYLNSTQLFFLLYKDYHDKQLEENTKVKLDLLTDIDMLLMVGKVSEVEYVMLTSKGQANSKYMKNYDKIKNHQISSIRA